MNVKNHSIICILILISVSVSFGQLNNRPKVPESSEPNPRLAITPVRPHPYCAECLEKEKYLKHYYAKGCKPVQGSIICEKLCPEYFDCPKEPVETSPTGCEYKGQVYKFDEKVPVDDPCKAACRCARNIDRYNISTPKITCANVECFGDYSLLPDNCYNVYESGKCCSSRQECPSDKELATMRKCLYNGREYKLGEQIYPKEDPCIVCTCSEDWNQSSPLSSSACKKTGCDFEFNAKSKEGCIPIYHEGVCCPVGYHCPPPKPLHCSFDGQQYKIGQKLDIDRVRTECTCLIPPEFTCIQKSVRGKTLASQPSELVRPAPQQTLSNLTRLSQPIRGRILPDTLDIKDPEFGALDIEPTANKTSNRTESSEPNPRLAITPVRPHPYCAECLEKEKYLKHYYAKGCKPVQGSIICEKPCPEYFDCPKEPVGTSPTGCEYKGQVYKFDEKVPVDDPCRVECRCDLNIDRYNISTAEITCADVECFGDYSLLPDNCYNVYESGKCCSSRQECPSDEELATMRKCLYNGREYKLGEQIYPKEDPCIVCTCSEDWNQSSPLSSSACRKTGCDFEFNAKSKEGCIPIYHEGVCCPVGYHCPPPKPLHCSFDGQQYRIGQKLDIDRVRTECTCLIPPEFTCIQKSVRAETLASQPSELVSPAPQQTPSNLTRLSQPLLSQPIRGRILPDTLLPVSRANEQQRECPPFIPGGLSCAGFNCTTIIDANGCQACSCERPCPELECNDPCYVYAVTPGECPKCKCP